ncbi:MAG: deoxycytidylate deaminase [bacterium]
MNTEKWDRRFLELSQLVAGWSKDPSTKTGAVIISPDRTIIAVGYNGFSKSMDDRPELYADRETKYSRIVHCEMNAVLNAKQSVHGCTLYTWPFASCDRCAVHMIQAGITTFVFPVLPKELEGRWRDSVIKTKSYFDEASVQWREI